MSTPSACPHCGADNIDVQVKPEDRTGTYFACGTRISYDGESFRVCRCYERELAALRSRAERLEKGLRDIADEIRCPCLVGVAHGRTCVGCIARETLESIK